MADASVGKQFVRDKNDMNIVKSFECMNACIANLQEPYTVTIRMVSDFLTYDRVFSQTSGASHFINILKYSKEKRQFFIVDGDIPSAKTSCFSGWVDEDDIICGWEEQIKM